VIHVELLLVSRTDSSSCAGSVDASGAKVKKCLLVSPSDASTHLEDERAKLRDDDARWKCPMRIAIARAEGDHRAIVESL